MAVKGPKLWHFCGHEMQVDWVGFKVPLCGYSRGDNERRFIRKKVGRRIMKRKKRFPIKKENSWWTFHHLAYHLAWGLSIFVPINRMGLRGEAISKQKKKRNSWEKKRKKLKKICL